MTTYLPRTAWTDEPADGSSLTAPLGVAVHWPGSAVSYADASEARIGAALESFRRQHVTTNGWADVAYQVAIDQAGRVWDLRGVDRRPAANGDDTVNRLWGAVLFLLGPDDEVTPAMAEAFADWRRDRWLTRWPDADRVTTHSRIRVGGTACPGPAATAYVTDQPWRTRTEPDPEDDDMPITEAEFGRLSGDMLRQANRAARAAAAPVVARLAALESVIRSETADGPALVEAARAGAALAIADARTEADAEDPA